MTAGARLWCVAACGVTAVMLFLGGAWRPPQAALLGGALAAIAGGAVLLLGRPRREEWLLLAVILVGGIAAVMRPLAPVDSKAVLAAWLAALLLWAAARRLHPAESKLAARVLVAGAAVLALQVVLAAAWRGPWTGGPLRNPNDAAAALVPVIALVPLGLRDRRLRYVALAVLALGALATASRAGALALLAVGLLGLPRGRARRLVIVAGLVVVVIVGWWRLGVRDDKLAWHRPQIWRAVATLVLQRPVLGWGPGVVEEAGGRVRLAHPEEPIALHGHRISSAESSLMALVLATGLVGAALAAGAGWLWGRRLVAASDPGVIGAAAAVGVLAAIHDFTEMGAILVWWGLVLGVAEAHRSTAGLPRLSRDRVAAALLVGLVLAWGLVQPAAARWVWTARGPDDGARDAALRLEPWYPAPAEHGARRLLALPVWSWDEAAPALYWSGEAVRRRPGDHDLWRLRAAVLSRVVGELRSGVGVIEDARAAFATATRLEPRLPWSWWGWASFERSLGQLNRARELAAVAVETEPNFVRGWLLLARIDLDLGRVESARAALGRAREAVALSDQAGSQYERDLLLAPEQHLGQLTEALQ